MTTVRLSQVSYPVMLGFECGLSLILLHAFKNAHDMYLNFQNNKNIKSIVYLVKYVRESLTKLNSHILYASKMV